MTGELTTRFPHPTPVETRLRIEARLDSVDGRKIRTSGEIIYRNIHDYVTVFYAPPKADTLRLKLRPQKNWNHQTPLCWSALESWGEQGKMRICWNL